MFIQGLAATPEEKTCDGRAARGVAQHKTKTNPQNEMLKKNAMK